MEKTNNAHQYSQNVHLSIFSVRPKKYQSNLYDMSRRSRKNNTGKKKTVLFDELQIRGAGVYCFLPFERLDKYKKAVFKIGITSGELDHRLDNYHTYFPEGVYMVAFLNEVPVAPRTRRRKERLTAKMVLLKVEKFIMQTIRENGGQLMYSSTRVLNADEHGKGASEWIYTDELTIHHAFRAAKKKFGGKEHFFYLSGYDAVLKRRVSINENAKTRKSLPHYVGEIYFHVKAGKG